MHAGKPSVSVFKYRMKIQVLNWKINIQIQYYILIKINAFY